MKVMTYHHFFDEEVKEVVWRGNCAIREIRLDTGSLLLSKDDVIALAREFELVVFEQDAQL